MTMTPTPHDQQRASGAAIERVTFYFVHWDASPPRMFSRELTLAPAGTPCGLKRLVAPAWGSFHDGAFHLWGYTPDEVARYYGYALTEADAIDIAIEKVKDQRASAKRALDQAIMRLDELVTMTATPTPADRPSQAPAAPKER